ncbi:maltose permease [Grosmannia clavigera kw1407]|uniref:Maltose permease n=1 Tax=Grosmannia clavigera (strain kw1407 / UAMH 11150) TaxID=655863 RepID=F0XAT7_GROCL|nr:maltose permease [Grosmannia clavigera kw1407]EFX05667.1 maltose permease [Grosmannia clavigera kw1407]
MSDKDKDEHVGSVEHVHDAATEADLGRIAESQEHQLNMLQAIRKQPLVFAWAFFANVTCLLVSFENQAGGTVLSIPEFRKDFGYAFEGSYVLETKWQSAFYGGGIAASIVGTFGAGFLADIVGRRPVINGALLLSFASVSLEYVATTNGIFFAGKFLNGLVAGILMTVSITYVGEITPLALRGLTTCLSALMMTIGPLTAAIIVEKTGTTNSRWAYRAIFCSQYAFSGLCILFAPFMPESPMWLLSSGHRDRAVASLRRLGYRSPDLDVRLSQIQTMLDGAREEAAGGTYLDCFRRSNLRRTVISVMPMAIQALSGVYFIASYGTYYIQLAGYSTNASFKLNIVQQGLAMFGNICSWYLVDHVGRRSLTLYGTISITIILLIAASLATEGSPGAIKGSVAFIIIYNYFYNVSLGATAYTLLCEVSTSKLRVKTISIGVALQYAIYCVWAFVIPYMFNPNEANMGAKTAYVFGGLGMLCIVYLWFYQPETAGRSFQELDEMFQKGVSVRDFRTYKSDFQTRDEKEMAQKAADN